MIPPFTPKTCRETASFHRHLHVSFDKAQAVSARARRARRLPAAENCLRSRRAPEPERGLERAARCLGLGATGVEPRPRQRRFAFALLPVRRPARRADVYEESSGGMTRRGRDRCRGLRGIFGDPTAAMGRPGPSDPVWTTQFRFVFGDLTAGRKPATHASRISGGAGRARLACGSHGGASTPGQSSSGPFPSSQTRPVCARHRYASVKIREGVPVTDLAAQLGHARKSMTLDTDSHVLIDSEGRRNTTALVGAGASVFLVHGTPPRETGSPTGRPFLFSGLEFPRSCLWATRRYGDNRTRRSCGHAGTNL
jgi:hypothetical protein